MSAAIVLIVCSVMATVALAALVTYCFLEIRRANAGEGLLTSAERLEREREQRAAWINPHARPPPGAPGTRSASREGR